MSIRHHAAKTARTIGQALGIVERAEAIPGDFSANVTPPPRTASGRDATSLDAVYRALTILQTATAQLGIDVYAGEARIDSPAWISQPDPWRGAAPQFFGETTTHLAARGCAFWRVNRDASNQITGLRLLNPDEVTQDFTGRAPKCSWRGKDYSRADLIPLALLRLPGRPEGLSPIAACRETIDGAIAMRRWADNWLDSSGVPGGILKTANDDIDIDRAKAAKAGFIEAARNRSVVVLTDGLAYEPIMLSPQDMQWLDSQNFNVTAIARLFGIPARLMLASVEGGSQTYSNLQQEDLSFVRWTLMTYLREIETALTWLLPPGQKAKFNLDAILRPDTKTRYEAHKIGIEAGFLTVDEVREIENL